MSVTTFAQDVGTLLVNAGVCSTAPATSTGYRLFYRDVEPTPDNEIVVMASGGLDGEQVVQLDYPRVQVIVRGGLRSSSGLELTVAAVNQTLHLYDGIVNGRYYPNIVRSGDVQWMGRDSNQRPQFSLNFQATRSRTT